MNKTNCYSTFTIKIFSLGEVPYPGLSWSLGFVDNLEKGFRMLRPKHAPVNLYEAQLYIFKQK